MKQREAVKVHRIYVESVDGEAYGGETFTEVVDAMRVGSWGGDQADGVRGYMRQVAKRIWDWSEAKIRTNTPEAFLRDMAAQKLLRLRVKEAR